MFPGMMMRSGAYRALSAALRKPSHAVSRRGLQIFTPRDPVKFSTSQAAKATLEDPPVGYTKVNAAKEKKKAVYGGIFIIVLAIATGVSNYIALQELEARKKMEEEQRETAEVNGNGKVSPNAGDAPISDAAATERQA